MKDKYYKPKLTEAKPLNIPKDESEEGALGGVGRVIKTKIDNDVIIQRVSHDLYSSWRSGLRELFNNEARACRIVNREAGKDIASIKIIINSIERDLTIQGINSLGITSEIFEDVVATLGVSTNHDSKEIGQFGMGFASYTTIFEAMMIDSYARENGDRFSALADSGVEFKILPTVSLKQYGTRLKGTYDEKINADHIIDEIESLAKFCNVEVIIELEEGTEYHQAGRIVPKVWNNVLEYLEAGLKDKIDENTYGRTSRNIIAKREIEIKRDDFDFTAMLMITDGAYDRSDKIDSNALCCETLLGTPIKIGLDNDIQECVSAYVLNVKDERRYPPPADRDRLTDDSIFAITSEVREELEKEYSEFILASAKDYTDRISDPSTSWIYEEYTWRDLKDIVNDSFTTEIVSVMNRHYQTKDSHYGETLYRMLQKYKNKKIVGLSGLRKDLYERLETVFNSNNVQYFRFSNEDTQASFDIMKSCGIIMGEEYIREHRLKSKVKKRIKGEFANVPVKLSSSVMGVYSQAWGRSHHGGNVSRMLSDINENTHDFMLQLERENFESIVENSYGLPFIFMKPRKSLKAPTFNESMKEIGNTEFYVGGIVSTLKELIDKSLESNNKKTITLINIGSEFESLEELTIEELSEGFEKHNYDSNYIFITPVSLPDKELVDSREVRSDMLTSQKWEYITGMIRLYCQYYYKHKGRRKEINYKFDDDGTELCREISHALFDNEDGEAPDLNYEARDSTQHGLLLMRLSVKLGLDSALFKLARESLQYNADSNTEYVDKLVKELT